MPQEEPKKKNEEERKKQGVKEQLLTSIVELERSSRLKTQTMEASHPTVEARPSRWIPQQGLGQPQEQ